MAAHFLLAFAVQHGACAPPAPSRLAPARRGSVVAARAALRLSDDGEDQAPRLAGNFRTDGIFRPGPGSDASPLPFKAVRPRGEAAGPARAFVRAEPTLVPTFASDAERQAAEELVMARLELALLEACAPCFRAGVSPPPAQATSAIVELAEALEQAARARQRDGSAPDAAAVRRALGGDWRLAFTDSAKALAGGLSGYGALPLCSTAAILQRLGEGRVRAQCVELLRLPLGATSALVLKGGWRMDEDEQGCLLACEYSALDVAGVPNAPALPAGGQLVATALVHVGARARLERAPSGALFVYARLPEGASLEAELRAFLGR